MGGRDDAAHRSPGTPAPSPFPSLAPTGLDTERVNRAQRTGKPHPEPLGTHPRPGSSSRHAREERTPDAYARLGPATTGRALPLALHRSP